MMTDISPSAAPSCVTVSPASISGCQLSAFRYFLVVVLCVMAPGCSLAQGAHDIGLSAANGQMAPEAVVATGGHNEVIDVTGPGMVPLSRSYRHLERIFRRFDSFPEADRQGLTLHLRATLQPGDRPARESGMIMKPGGRIIHMITVASPGAEDEITVPHEAALWEADPALYARLRPGEHLRIGFFFSITSPDRQYFTQQQAQKWLSQLDACIEDEGGFLVSLLLPDTHRLRVRIAPDSRFMVRQEGVEHLLVDNQGNQPYSYVFRPQDFAKDAAFVASRPLRGIEMTLPFALHGNLKPK